MAVAHFDVFMASLSPRPGDSTGWVCARGVSGSVEEGRRSREKRERDPLTTLATADDGPNRLRSKVGTSLAAVEAAAAAAVAAAAAAAAAAELASITAASACASPAAASRP